MVSRRIGGKPLYAPVVVHSINAYVCLYAATVTEFLVNTCGHSNGQFVLALVIFQFLSVSQLECLNRFFIEKNKKNKKHI